MSLCEVEPVRAHSPEQEAEEEGGELALLGVGARLPPVVHEPLVALAEVVHLGGLIDLGGNSIDCPFLGLFFISDSIKYRAL